MSAINFNKTHDLGQWNYYKTDEKVNQELFENGHPVHLKVNEKTSLNLYRINPYTGSVDRSEELQIKSLEAQKVYDHLLKTKPESRVGSTFLSLFVAPRTQTLKDIALDVFIPNTRRFYAIMDGKDSLLSKTITVINTLILDLFTLVIRVVTLIPRTIYNHVRTPHSLKPHLFHKDVEAIYVECEKQWTVEGTPKEGESWSSQSQNACFAWRVDFYTPLQNLFEYNGKTYSLDSNFGDKRNLFEEEESMRSRINFSDDDFFIKCHQIGNLWKGSYNKPERLGSNYLDKICKRPEVTFC